MIVHGRMFNNKNKTKCFKNIKDLLDYEALKVVSPNNIQMVTCNDCKRNHIPGAR